MMRFLRVSAVLVLGTFTATGRAQTIDFETTPAGGTPLDDARLTSPYSFGATSVHFGFDTDNDLAIDTEPNFELRGGVLGESGWAYRTGPSATLENDVDLTPTGSGGSWLLRKPMSGVDPLAGHDFLIVYSGALPTTASGQIWDIDGYSGVFDKWQVDALDASGQVVGTILSPAFQSMSNPPSSSYDGWPWNFCFLDLPQPIKTVRCSFLGVNPGSVGFAFDNFLLSVTSVSNYCTAGTSAAGCLATLSATGLASATSANGFTVTSSSLEGQKNGQFFWSTNGKNAGSWGNGSSFRCTIPPNNRGGLLFSGGTVGACNGSVSQDLNARWQAKPAQNPGSGALVQVQYWYRDPLNTSNQTTSFSDALEFCVAP